MCPQLLVLVDEGVIFIKMTVVSIHDCHFNNPSRSYHVMNCLSIQQLVVLVSSAIKMINHFSCHAVAWL